MTMQAAASSEKASSGGYWSTVLTRPVLSWSLYDLANTVFSMSIVSLILPLWVLDNGGAGRDLGLRQQPDDGPRPHQRAHPRCAL